MTPVEQSPVIFQVVNNFGNPQLSQEVSRCLNNLLQVNENPQEVPQFAQNFLTRIHQSRTDQKRYKFQLLSPKDEFLQAIFDASFSKASEPVIQAAQNQAGVRFYPLWKRVIWIDLPRMTSTVASSFFVKIAISVYVYYRSYCWGEHAFTVVRCTLNDRVIPFVMTHIPHLINNSRKATQWMFNNYMTILVICAVVKMIILRLPRIPYVTDAVQRVNLWQIWGLTIASGQDLAGFLWQTSWRAGAFVFETCSDVGAFFGEISIKEESRLLTICRAKAQEIWRNEIQRVIDANQPQQA